ncbi:uncharacterized protein LOC132277536 [Cornus florida]|uniref:uncharacterized protein LOC132277536 n=1 Tax=Cornus florida TaxID=4283 RepID=UPI002897B0F0|nr:uncharacterized protein LOC132277536 [Cornus florida]
MGKRPYYPHFKAFIEKHWSKAVTLVYLKNGFFMWNNNVTLKLEEFDSLPVWIRVHDLPVHCRNSKSLSKVCSLFSKPIYMDDPSLHQDKGQFIRVMVEVDVKQEFPKKLVIDVHGEDCIINIEYEWKPAMCSLCKRVDHVADRCPQKVWHKPKSKQQVGDRWVVKQKRKMVAVDDAQKVSGKMPIRQPQSSQVATHNSFALLEQVKKIEEIVPITKDEIDQGEEKEKAIQVTDSLKELAINIVEAKAIVLAEVIIEAAESVSEEAADLVVSGNIEVDQDFGTKLDKVMIDVVNSTTAGVIVIIFDLGDTALHKSLSSDSVFKIDGDKKSRHRAVTASDRVTRSK